MLLCIINRLVYVSEIFGKLYFSWCTCRIILPFNPLHHILFTLTGVPKDLSRALSIYESTCHKGSSGACNNAGLVWKTALPDKPADYSRAADYFLRACKGGHKNGCFNLSTLYLQGGGSVAKDMQSALSFSLKSCELGHPYGCANAARMYMLGDGVDVNTTKAEELKKKAKKFMNP